MITKEDALNRAIKNLEAADALRYDGYADPSEAKALIARAKVESAKTYIELAKMLDK